jgi:Starch-binding associating with outer membrane
MKHKLIILLSSLIISTSFSSCKKWLDVNDNPNIVKDANVELILPSAQVGIATVMGNEMQVNGGIWAQYWTQSPLANQYKAQEQFQMSPDDYNNAWSYFYAYALQDLNKLAVKAAKDNKTQYLAISKLLTAYSFQVVTDAWGDVPFTDALKGGGASNITSPKYDNQEAIYSGIITLIEDADKLIDETATVHPGADDLMFGGDMASWRAFGNTLKLKVALRLSSADESKGKTLAKSIETASGEFLSDGYTDAKIIYGGTGGNQNPLYSFMIGTGNTQNIYGSKTCIDAMNSLSDPRVELFYTVSKSGVFNGLQQGAYNKSDSIDVISPGGAAVGAEANNEVSGKASVKFISISESHFLVAEAISRGWITGTKTAEEEYQAGIQSSMDEYGVSATASGDYIALPANAFPSSDADKVKSIITQKYFAMCGNQCFEAWTEWRRTGYPSIFVTPPYSVLGSQFPARFLYPASELTLNTNYPLGGAPLTKKVWWDKN